MSQLNLSVTADVAKLIIASRLAAFQGQQMDEVLYREMAAHLNNSIHPSIGADFNVSAFPHEDGIGINVSFLTGSCRMTIGLFQHDMRARVEAIHAELDHLVDAAAAMSKEAVDGSRPYVAGPHSRWLAIANTHFQQGFAALRRARSEEDPDAY